MKYVATLLFSILISFSSAQLIEGKFFVKFTDKNNSPYSIENPSEYLSYRAIDRRENQGILVDESDLPVNPQYLSGVEAAGAQLLNPTKWMNGVTVAISDLSIIPTIEALPYVEYVINVYEPVTVQAAISEKPFFKNESYNLGPPTGQIRDLTTVSFDYGQAYNQIEMLKGDQIHDMGYLGKGMVIAVLDAGFINADIHPAFDSLWSNDRILGTRDFVDGGEVTFDAHPHGSMVLGCMGSNYPGQIIGTAPEASYWLLRPEDGDTEYIIEEYNWISAAEFADSAGADIINSSLGYTEFFDPSQNHTYEDLDGNTIPITIGADMAADKGILVVNSAGNEGNNSWYYHSAPSDGFNVMGIGAVDPEGYYVSFSGHGPTYDGRTKPNVVAQGSYVFTVDPYNLFTYSGGTSFSSPIIAGMSACLWQANPEMTNMDVKSALEQSADKYLNPDDEFGFGIPDYMMANNILTTIETQEKVTSEVYIYPNPATDQITINWNPSGNLKEGRVVVSDLAGKIILDQEFNQLNSTLDVSIINQGTYIVILYNGTDAIKTRKLVKM